MSEHPGRARSWVFTVNNYTADDLEMVKAVEARSTYVVAGLEVGEQGTPHIQGYVHYANARTFASMKKALPRANLQIAKGTGAQNRTYCTKDGNVLIEAGVVPSQGKRVDLEDIYAMLEAGANMNAILDTQPNLQCIKVAEQWLKYKEPQRNFKTEVHWFHGDPGTGKSRDAEAVFEGVFYSPPPTSVAKFWDCYDADENVIIDELEPGDIPYRSMLRMFDRYAYRLETKGGTRQLLAKTIYICTEDPPEAFVPKGKDPYALLRRLTSVTHYQRAPDAELLYQPARFTKVVGNPPADVCFQTPADDFLLETGSDLEDDDDLRSKNRQDYGGSLRGIPCQLQRQQAEHSDRDRTRPLPVRQEGCGKHVQVRNKKARKASKGCRSIDAYVQ